MKPEVEPSNRVNFNGLGREIRGRKYWETMSVEMKLLLHPESRREVKEVPGIKGTVRVAMRC